VCVVATNDGGVVDDYNDLESCSLSLSLRLGRVGRRQVGGLQLAAICREVFQLKNASGLLCFPYTPNAIITNVSHKKNMKNRKKNDI
jgi:hypothetical protein